MSVVSYTRGKFVAELPAACRYTASHYWLLEERDAVWRVGVTQFAAWMLGEPVELALSVSAGATVSIDEDIGWVEGLKTVNTIHAVVAGEFLGAGDEVLADVTLLDADPQGRGWLYRVRGTPLLNSLDACIYTKLLDDAVDTVMRLRREECGGDCED